MLGQDKVLILEYISFLARQTLHQLIKSILDLLSKISKNKFIVYEQLLYHFMGKLYLKWEIIFNWSHLVQLKELIYLGSILMVVICANQEIAEHLIFNLKDFPELIDIEHFVFF